MTADDAGRDRRLAIALLAGLLFAVWAYADARATGNPRSDFDQVWFAARALLAGENPYALIGPGRTFHWGAGFLYPLPAALAVLPLAAIPLPAAALCFAGIGAAALAWALQRHGPWPLLLLCTPPVFEAVDQAQWSPLLAAALVVPPLGALLVAKPTVGAALWAARPSWWAPVAGTVLVVVSLWLHPGWVADWLATVRAYATADLVFDKTAGQFSYGPPVLRPGGVLVLLALLRWRLWEARLLVALACVPQSPWAYELVPLLLLPRTRHEVFGVAGAAAVGYVVAWLMPGPQAGPQLAQQLAVEWAWMALMFYYLPALVLVLRRENAGPAPAWIERVFSRAPRWLRGQPSPTSGAA